MDYGSIINPLQPDKVKGLDFVGASEQDDILGSEHVGSVKRLIRVNQVDGSGRVDHRVNFVEEIPETMIPSRGI